MNKRQLTFFQKLFFEFFSVTLAVFLGLMMNQWRDAYNNKKTMQLSLNNIKAEVSENSEKITKILTDHQAFLVKLDSIISSSEANTDRNDTLANLYFTVLSSTAWESAKLTQSIRNMDIELVSDIAGVYEIQEYYELTIKQYVLNSIDKTDIYFETDTPEAMAELKKLSTFLRSRIIPTERDLIKYYEELNHDVFEKNT